MQIVIDTNIWIKALSNDDDYSLTCDRVLLGFLNESTLQLALDSEWEIEKEYMDNLQMNRRYQCIMCQLENEHRRTWNSSHLPQKHLNKLDELQFHEPEDRIFVGVAYNTDKKIITEDSDYGVHGEVDKKGVYDYMREKMDLDVYSAEETLETILK